MGMLLKRHRKVKANGQARPEPHESGQPEERAQGQESEGQQETPLEEMSKKELLHQAQAQGIEANDRMTKAELVDLLGGEHDGE